MRKDEYFLEEEYEELTIESIEFVETDEAVYNLEVEENSSFCVTEDKIIVHNCDMGLTGKLLNNLFALDDDLNEIGATVLLASKVYTNLNNPYDPWVMSGGQSVIYNPSLNIKLQEMSETEEMSDSEKKEEKERRKTSLGNSMKVIRATATKSRFGTEGRNCWFILDNTYGPIRNSGMLKLLLDFKLAVKEGTKYTVPGVIDTPFFKKDFLKVFAEHEEEYIDKLQPLLDMAEERIKQDRKAAAFGKGDLGEFTDEEDDSNSFEDMATELEQEMSEALGD